MIVDESFDPRPEGDYTLTRIHHIDGHVLRVQVRRNSHLEQSYGVVEVLTPDLTWTVIAEAPPAGWHHATPYRAQGPEPLTPVAEELLVRGRRILTPAGDLPAADTRP